MTDNDGNTPLYLAVEEGHMAVVRHLSSLTACAVDKNHLNNAGATLLQSAAQGYIDVVCHLDLLPAVHD